MTAHAAEAAKTRATREQHESNTRATRVHVHRLAQHVHAHKDWSNKGTHRHSPFRHSPFRNHPQQITNHNKYATRHHAAPPSSPDAPVHLPISARCNAFWLCLFTDVSDAPRATCTTHPHPSRRVPAFSAHVPARAFACASSGDRD